MDHSETIKELLAKATGPLQSVLLQAYNAGRSAGKLEGYEQARKEMERKIQAVLSAPAEKVMTQAVTIPKSVSLGQKPGRAQSGSVRPAVIAALEKERGGLRPQGAMKVIHSLGHTDIKESTVRAMLNKMLTEGVTEKRGNLWFLADAKAGQTSIFEEDSMTTTPH